MFLVTEGLDELRQLQRYDPVRRQVQGPPMQCYCDVRTMRHCRPLADEGQ